MAPVVHVIAITDLVDVNVVGLVPGTRPVFRPRINQTDPEACVLKSGMSVHDDDGNAVNAKPMSAAKVGTKAVFRNAVASVASAFAPTMMFALPMLGTMVLPDISRSGVLFPFMPARLVHPLRPIRMVSIRVLDRRAPALLLVLVSMLLLGTRLPAVLAAVLCVCQSSCSYKQAQY